MQKTNFMVFNMEDSKYYVVLTEVIQFVDYTDDQFLLDQNF